MLRWKVASWLLSVLPLPLGERLSVMVTIRTEALIQLWSYSGRRLLSKKSKEARSTSESPRLPLLCQDLRVRTGGYKACFFISFFGLGIVITISRCNRLVAARPLWPELFHGQGCSSEFLKFIFSFLVCLFFLLSIRPY